MNTEYFGEIFGLPEQASSKFLKGGGHIGGQIVKLQHLYTTYPCRCHVILHQEKCGERAIQCTVRGCKTIYRRKHQEEHVTKAASSHAVLQEGEVQLLRQIIHFKARHQYDLV